MAGCILVAALMVIAFPLRWASVVPQLAPPGLAAAEEGAAPQAGGSARSLSRASRTFAAGMCTAGGEAMLMCPEPIRWALLRAVLTVSCCAVLCCAATCCSQACRPQALAQHAATVWLVQGCPVR